MSLNDGLSPEDTNLLLDELVADYSFSESEAQQLVNETENLADLIGLLSFSETMNLAAAKLLKINSQSCRVPTEYILCVADYADEPHRSEAKEILESRYCG